MTFNNHEEAMTRAQQIQCVALQIEIPGLSNNNTGTLNHNKIISIALVDQVTDESSGPNQLK